MCCTDVISVVTQRTVRLQLLLQVLGIEMCHWPICTCCHALSHTLLSGCSCIVSTEIVLFRSRPVAIHLACLDATHKAQWTKGEHATQLQTVSGGGHIAACARACEYRVSTVPVALS